MGEVISNWVLDYAEKLLVGIGRSNGEAVQQLDHETGEALEGSGNANRRRDLNEDTLGGGYVNLEAAGLVDGRVEEGQKALRKREASPSQHVGCRPKLEGTRGLNLVSDVGTSIANVAIHLAHNANMLIAV